MDVLAGVTAHDPEQDGAVLVVVGKLATARRSGPGVGREQVQPGIEPQRGEHIGRRATGHALEQHPAVAPFRDAERRRAVGVRRAPGPPLRARTARSAVVALQRSEHGGQAHHAPVAAW